MAIWAPSSGERGADGGRIGSPLIQCFGSFGSSPWKRSASRATTLTLRPQFVSTAFWLRRATSMSAKPSRIIQSESASATTV